MTFRELITFFTWNWSIFLYPPKQNITPLTLARFFLWNTCINSLISIFSGSSFICYWFDIDGSIHICLHFYLFKSQFTDCILQYWYLIKKMLLLHLLYRCIRLSFGGINMLLLFLLVRLCMDHHMALLNSFLVKLFVMFDMRLYLRNNR